jgi:hypothetical protein
MGDWLDDWLDKPDNEVIKDIECLDRRSKEESSDKEYIDYLIEQYKTTNDKDKKKKISDELYKYYGIIVETESIITEKTKIQDGSKLTELESISKEKITRSKENDAKVGIENKYHKDSILNYLNLSSDNFIMQYINTMSELTSAYPEWHFAMAVSTLSIITNRKIRIHLQHKVVFPNIWFFLLGLSTISQKTTAMKLGKELTVRLKSNDIILRRLSGSFSPEGFLDDLQSHPNGYIWKDEAGDLLQSMKKEYMSNMRDIFCDIYESDYYYRKLKKSEILINNIFMNMVLATTPDNFKTYTQLLDLTSGWLFRFLYLHAEYDKSRSSLAERTDKQNKRLEKLVDILKAKITIVRNINGETQFVFGNGTLDIYEKWSERMYKRAMKNKNEIESAFIGRIEDYVLKLAILFAFGEKGNSIEISKEIMTICCNLAENYFLPLSINIAEMVSTNEKDNKMDKIMGTIKRAGGRISRTKLIQNVHIKSKELDELCGTLVEGDEIKLCCENRITYYEIVKENR